MLIIDTSGLVYTVAYKIKQRVGEFVDNIEALVVRDTLKSLVSIMYSKSFSQIVFVFDGGNALRRQIYPEYKCDRKSSPLGTLVGTSTKLLYEYVFATKSIVLKCIDVEADDIIAMIVEEKEKHSDNILIMTRDRDLWQLTKYPNVKLIDFYGNIINIKFSPSELVAYKILVGDPSDNIKGLPGIGPKKAILLLAECGNLKNIVKKIKKDGAIGKLNYQQAFEIIKRNIALIKLDGSIVPTWMRKAIVSNFEEQQNKSMDTVRLTELLDGMLEDPMTGEFLHSDFYAVNTFLFGSKI